MAFGAANSIYCDKIISYSKRVRRKCSARATARFVLNALAKPRLYSEWFTYVECRIPEGVPQDTAMRLVEHSARHYVRRGFGVREMMTIVSCHYDLFAERFPPSAVREMNVSPGVVLSEVTGKGGGRYQITLLQRATREGEIEFYFWDTKLSARLARIRGVIGPDSTGRKAFWVGTLQGPLPPLGRAEISAATRDLCGLRP